MTFCQRGWDCGIATLFGHIGEFVEGCNQWLQYIKRLRHFLAANEIMDTDRKRYFSGSNWAECLQAVVEFGSAREDGEEDIYGPCGCDDAAP